MSKRIAIVAGAGGELGRAVAVTLAATGVTVVGLDRNEPGLKELPEDIGAEVCDATDPAASGPVVDRIAAEIGPPDILVNTIGAYQVGDALSVTPQTLRQMIDVNLGPAIWLTQAVAPHMQQKGSGAIVHVASRPGLEPTPGVAAYAMAKAALVHLIRTLDVELRASGLRVNGVAPQIIATSRNKELFPTDALTGAVEPAAIADVIAYLASDDSDPISGAILPAYGVMGADR